MRKAIALSFAIATLLILAAAPAAADPATTSTMTVKNFVETFVDAEPCSGTAGTVTTTSNGVFHVTVKDGTEHATFTQAGTFTFTPTAGGPTATGHFAIWGGFNVNSGGNVAGTFTFNVSGERSDGSRFSGHGVDHINTTPTGTANFFSKFHC